MTKKEKVVPAYEPTKEESQEYNEIMNDVIKGRNVIQKSYNQFNGRNLYDCLDDWQKRWNGYLPMSSVLTQDRSNIVMNFTRNIVIGYVSKIVPPITKIIAVNKNTNKENIKFADALNDLITYSNNEESADSKFKESALDCAVKGTVIKYEGYLKQEQEMEVPDVVDPETGKMKTKKQKRLLFDNAYQENVPIEDFYIANPYQPDVQKQPFVIWKKCTSYDEAKWEFGNYPKFDFVNKGSYTLTSEPTTFYRNQLYTELNANQVEVLLYYNKTKNKHVILVNGVPLYSGVIPRKDNQYPFAKAIHEPFDSAFFWGMSLPQKFMGESDLAMTMFNMMVDKTYGSLMPFGLSSDLDDLVEDTVLEPNKIRKVGDVNNWRFETLPGVSAGEQAMLQTTISFMKDNAGTEGGASANTPRGGKQTMRQAMLKQQESMQKMGFNTEYLEEFERQRTKLRLGTILQYYSIPKLEKITNEKGKEIEQLMYREIVMPGAKLEGGNTGTKVIRLFDNETGNDKNKSEKMANDMFTEELESSDEKMPELDGTYHGTKRVADFLNNLKKNIMAINVDSFFDYNTRVQVVKNSTHERNQMMDRAERMEYANWRLGIAQQAPCNAEEVVKWVDESYDIDSDRFVSKQQAPPAGLDPEAAQQAGISGGEQNQAPVGPNRAQAQSKPTLADMMA